MFLVKAKIDGKPMVLPCQGVGPDPRNPALTRLDGIDIMINNFRATFISVQPQDIEFIAEGVIMPPAQQQLPPQGLGENGAGPAQVPEKSEPEVTQPEG